MWPWTRVIGILANWPIVGKRRGFELTVATVRKLECGSTPYAKKILPDMNM